MRIRIVESNIDKIAVDKLNNLLKLLELSDFNQDVSEENNESAASQVAFTKSQNDIANDEYFIIVFHDGDQIDKSILENEMCLGVFFADKSVEENLLNMKNAIEGLKAMELQKKLLYKMNSVMEGLVGQVESIREMHKNMAPFRSEKIRGVGITSRFCAGTSNGGEFFDFFKVGGDVWIISLHATSYMLIGSFLTMIEGWKAEGSLTMDKILGQLEERTEDFSEFGEASILVAKLTLADLTLESINIGAHEILSQNDILISSNEYSFPNSYEVKKQSVQLEKGKGVLLLSPGYFKNNDHIVNGEEYISFIKKNWSSPVELISELTFQSKKGYNEDDFLPNDQTILMVEVDKNAISKI
ncbi:hypothetical protein ABMA70_07410 [Halobacteriovorax sp. XZX-3]|uniref:hypothetical protein n=1 Tax=unclassified Halobacteriovorax TaxID=2639665 RepID=UPI000CD158C1|nr:hypothetical protein [Halobacteriovorax sp. DA5]POB12847.1 hypothetical protein C0Z22_13290 [Halobacteriovorax sp. DA5]